MSDSTQGNPALFQTPFDHFVNTSGFVNPAYSTPEQRKQLYAYADAMMKPQPVKSGWQGLAEIARALVGGYTSHLADQYESQNYAHNMGQTTPGADAASPAAPASYATGGPDAASAPSVAAPSPVPGPAAPPMAAAAALGAGGPFGTSNINGGGGYAEPAAKGVNTAALNPVFADRAQDLQEDAGALGVPSTMISGYRDNAKQAALYAAYKNGTGGIAAPPGQSYHNYGAAADIVANDPSKQGVLTDLAREPWRGLTPGANFGDPDHYQGAGPASAYAPSSGAAPAAAAIGAALTAPKGVQVAQNAPFTSGQLGAMVANPNLPDHIRGMALGLTQPQHLTDAVGNVSPMYQGQAVGAPIAHLGVMGAPSTLPGGIPNQPIYGGTPNAPTSHNLTPVGDVGGGGGAWNPQALDKLRGLAAFGQGVAAQGNVINDKAKTANDRFQATTDAQWKLQQAAQPLLQIKNVMDQNGGNLPTGVGADKLIDFSSAANMVGTLLGHPISKEDSTLSGLELMRKYGTQVAMSLTGHNTDMGLQAAEHVSPGIGLSQASNEHLIDNYLRLNRLAQTRAQYEREYYTSHGGAANPNAYDNFNNDWNTAITGKNAIPLSGEKYGRKVQVTVNGRPETRIVVPSTDTKGYSIYKPGDIPEVSTP